MLTSQQTAAIHALLDTTSHLALVARAGCGKTFTILEMVKAYTREFPRHEIVVAAYNKAIQQEIAGKLDRAGYNWRQVQAATSHSLGYGLLKFRFKARIDDHKVATLVAAEAVSDETCREHELIVTRLVKLAKQAGIGALADSPENSRTAWLDVIDHFGVLDDLEMDEDGVLLRKLLLAARGVLRKSNAQTDVVDFDDMVYLPLVHSVSVKFSKDLVIVDEAQDLSRTRQALLKKFLKPRTGRLVVVGDDRQAIYGFSGADSEALPRMIADLNAVVLPLNVTWRVPKSGVELAKALVPDFTAAPGASEGSVVYVEELPIDLGGGDAILCRSTAPLVGLAYELIRKGVGCKVEGRDIGAGIHKLAERWKVRTTAQLLERLSTYEVRELGKLAKLKNGEVRAEALQDRVGCLRFVVEEVNRRGKTSVADVFQFIDGLFDDDVRGVVTLCTYHRAKGREWRRVILLEHSKRCPSKWAKRPHEVRQEENLAYVSFTRHQETLVFFG